MNTATAQDEWPTAEAHQLFDEGEIRRALALMVEPDQVVELRALHATTKASRYAYTASGYFNDMEAFVKALSLIRSARGIYITLNPCQRDLLARAQNRLRSADEFRADKSCTTDTQITRLRWLLIDVDPERPSGISSSDAEHTRALQHAQTIRETLKSEGWPEPLSADSGNGAHLLYRIDLGIDEADLLARAFKGLAGRFDILGQHIDQTVFNPSRISKLYGTLACKGDNTDERPHRMSRILEPPSLLHIVSRTLLEAIATPVQHQASQNRQNTHKKNTFSLQDFLDLHAIQTRPPEPYKSGTRWLLAECPFCHESDHNACVYEFADGSLGFSCSHNRCADLHWKDFRKHFEPGYQQNSNGYRHHDDIDLDSIFQDEAKPKTPRTITIEQILDCLKQNEYGDALLFADLFEGQLLYDATEQTWYLWHEHYWKRDDLNQARKFVAGRLATTYLKASADLNDDQGETGDQIMHMREKLGFLEAEKDPAFEKLQERYKFIEAERKRLAERAKALRGATRNKNVQWFAQGDPRLAITSDRWDADPWLLGLENGVIDLHTGSFRDGRPGDYIRTVCPTEWKGLSEPCPRFIQFLLEIFEDKPADVRNELIAFLCGMFGYAITGKTSEHIFPILWGEEGRNGKDTLLTIIKEVLGKALASPVSKDVLISNDKLRAAGSASEHLADLQGKRIVWGAETRQGDKLNVSQIKELTGGGDIPARRNYGHQFSFVPTHTLLLHTNYKPRADPQDKAFWERACLIEFGIRFVERPKAENEREKDNKLSDKLKAEASGILAWLVRGCLAWQSQGLNRPESVLVATNKYRESEDELSLFITERCFIGEKLEVQAANLYDAYSTWCKAYHLSALNGKLFGVMMSKRYLKKKKGNVWMYYGLRIIADPPSPENAEDSMPGEDSSGMPNDPPPGMPNEPASEVPPDGEQKGGYAGSTGSFQEPPIYTPRESNFREFTGNFRHTRHADPSDDTVNQHEKTPEGTMPGQNGKYHQPPPTAPGEIPQSLKGQTCGHCGRSDWRRREDGRWLCSCWWIQQAKPESEIHNG